MASSKPNPFDTEDDLWQRPEGNGTRETLKAVLIALVMIAPIALGGGQIIRSDMAERARLAKAEAELQLAHERLVEGPAGAILAAEAAAHGRDLFLVTCAACHAADGTGVAGLGKDLTQSDFVASLDDAGLHAFLVTGRPGAKPLPMPPKGGNPDLTDDDLADVVAFLRGMQDKRRMPALPEPVAIAAAEPTEDDKAKALAAAGGDEELAEYIAFGSKIYATSCVACHGKDAKGLPGNGKDLVNSAFCKSLNDDDLLAFLKKGRDPSDPANTTGVGMPPKGGNPALSDDDLLDVIAYLRSLQTATN